MAQGSEIFFQVLEQVCETHIVSIAPICSLFILQIIKTISKVHLHNYAMNSLSNLIVGVYTNVKAIPMTPDLLLLSEEGVEFIKNFKNTDNFRYEL